MSDKTKGAAGGRRVGTAAEEGGTGPGGACAGEDLAEMAEALFGGAAAAGTEAGTTEGCGPQREAPEGAGGNAGSGAETGGMSGKAAAAEAEEHGGKAKGPRVNKDGTLDGRYKGARKTTADGIPLTKDGKPDPRFKYTPEQAVEAARLRTREKSRRHREREREKRQAEKAEKVRAAGGIDFGKANPKQAQFFASRTLYTAYGGARGGGKSWAVRVKAVGGALAYPGIKILLLRRTYPELQQNHITPIIKMVPQTLAAYNGSQRAMYFKNGSTIKFGHAQSAVGIETEYQGQEYDWIFMDEATQFTESEFRTLGGCLRGVNEIPKRFYLTCNPKHPQAGRV